MRQFIAIVIVSIELMMAGCAEEPQYRGSKATIRSFKDQAGPQDYYVGFDYNWALDRPSTTALTPAPEPIIHTPSPTASEAQGMMHASGQ